MTTLFRLPTMRLNFMTVPLLAFTGLLFAIATAATTNADIIEFKLTGAAGDGLLEGNIDPATGEPGTGGIGAAGILFNTNTNILRIHVEWGSANGYTDLSADVFKLHLHGPTPNAGTDAFGQTGPVLFTLSNSSSFDGSASSGGVNDLWLFDETDVPYLLDGRTYINVHLSDSDSGVIRGYILPVPEPSSMIPILFAGVAWLSTQRQRR
jgi:hypothetical protein